MAHIHTKYGVFEGDLEIELTGSPYGFTTTFKFETFNNLELIPLYFFTVRWYTLEIAHYRVYFDTIWRYDPCITCIVEGEIHDVRPIEPERWSREYAQWDIRMSKQM